MKPQTLEQKRNWLWEFSKKIVFTVTVIFIAVFFYACVLTWFNPDSTAIPSLLDNICDVFKVTVVSYCVKAGFENCTKIRKRDEE